MFCFIAQLCLTFCDPVDWSLLGSSVHGILQAKVLEWAAIPSSKGSSQPRDRTRISGIEPKSPSLQSDSLLSEPKGKPKNTGVVAYPFSRGSSQPSNQTGASCIAARFFTSWAMREALEVVGESQRLSCLKALITGPKWVGNFRSRLMVYRLGS